jgi:hypothetical protein
LYRRKNILVKEYILFSLQIAVITIKIKTTTKTTRIITKTTKTTETLVTIKHTDNLITTADLEDVVISVRKRIADYRNIQK